MRVHRILLFATFCLLCAAAVPGATQITLNVGASSLPEGSFETIPIITDAPLFTRFEVSVSDAAVLMVPATVTRSFGGTSLRVRFLKAGTATIRVSTLDGGLAQAVLTVTPGAVLTPLAVAPAIVQAANAGGRTATVAFTNSGTQPFDASLSSSAFDLSPQSLSIAPGATQTVTFAGRAMPAGTYTYDLPLPQKQCCPLASQTYTVTLVSLLPSGPAGGVGTDRSRLDIAAPADSAFAPIVVTFRNGGKAPVSGVVLSDVPWMEPLTEGLVTIPAEGSADVEVALERDNRPDNFNPLGTEVGSVSFVYANSGGGATALDSGGSTTTVRVSITDTITLATTPASLPSLGSNEVALLMPGLGNIRGSVGQFVSDLSLLNRDAQKTLSNLRLYFAPADGSQPYTGRIVSLMPSQTVRFADITRAFGEGPSGGEGKLGTLQLRVANLEQLALAASVFNASNPAGTYGTGVPPLRTDRAVPAGERIYLTGLRADDAAHTNLYLQEAAGRGVSVNIRYFDASGHVLGQRSESLDPWALRMFLSVVPQGAVSAELQHAGGSGTFLAYATPVDKGGDTWVVADWQRYYGVTASGAWVVPVAGVLRGGADTYFRTDLAIMSCGGSKATGTLRFLDRNGTIREKSLSMENDETFVSADVVTTFFGVTTDTAGFLMYVPGQGSTVMTSRTYSTKSNITGSYGTAVPSLSPVFAMRNGDRRQITAIEDAKSSLVQAMTPATFRTNFGLVETSGAPATVRVSLRYVVPATLTSANIVASRDYALTANQYLQQSVRDILGAAAPDDDLHNATLEFRVISGSGSVIATVSTVDNGTGDSLLRVD